MKNFIGEIFGFNKQINQLNKKVDALLIDIENLEKEFSAYIDTSKRTLEFRDNKIKYLTEENTKFSEEVAYLKKVMTMEENDLENYLNNKYPKINRAYLRYETDGQYQIDVRNFFQPFDYTLPTFTGKNFDDVALKCLSWVIDNIKYIPDLTEYKQNEYWAYSYQTLKNKFGDCEDGAILLANMMLASGIPYYRVRLNAGSVNGGGHCYVSYCRETDNQWVVLDFCYWPNKKPIKDRPTHKEERNYINKEKNYYVWFSWNQKYVFGEQKLPEELENKFK